MSSKVKNFHEISSDEQARAGGKGGALARLIQAGYPIPDGFVIMPSAFEDDQLQPEAWLQIVKNLELLRIHNGKTAFAVRSSALAEDSAYASFAGEFETVLDVHTDEAVKAAIFQVHHSRKSERVKAYSQAKGLSQEQEIAVVVQKLVRSDISGILFTADPITGNRYTMNGNYVFGFGEELVSGEVEPYQFTLERPKGKYRGPGHLKRYARKLFKLASRLEDELGCPQDIEWAVEAGKVYILQSRPITTLIDYDPTTGERNSTLSGDYVWMGHEVFPDVMTPSTTSIISHFHNFKIEGMKAVGNIGGRFYMNFSMVYAMMRAFGRSHDSSLEYIELTTGFNLRGVTLPRVPVSRWNIIKSMLPIQRELLPLQARLMKRFDEITANNPARCQELRQQIKAVTDRASLIKLWHEQVFPLFYDLMMIQDKSNEDYFFPYLAARKMLVKLMGEEDADELLVNLVGGSGELASLQPIMGVAKLISGEMSRNEYAVLAGHRLPQEDEISVPRPYEDPDWIDKRIAEYQKDPVDYDAMLAQRARDFERVWKEFSARYPKQSSRVKKKLDQASQAMEKREVIRSEFTRSFGVIRDWFLRAGKLAYIHGDSVFFLTDQEILNVLNGDESAVEYIPERCKTYQRQKALPKYPLVISGRFDPYTWAKDPQRRSDIFDSHKPLTAEETVDTIKGHPGSAGRVEGLVRIVHSPDESDLFKPGEILVASSTNVGWTPLFPRAAAVITDVGAPLSHAAIVARELGIPAVVGTGNATMRLRTGDKVLVDGGQGYVKVVGAAA
jgi:pyruvate,water dikinase